LRFTVSNHERTIVILRTNKQEEEEETGEGEIKRDKEGKE
jgi:hypothetical protein